MEKFQISPHLSSEISPHDRYIGGIGDKYQVCSLVSLLCAYCLNSLDFCHDSCGVQLHQYGLSENLKKVVLQIIYTTPQRKEVLFELKMTVRGTEDGTL